MNRRDLLKLGGAGMAAAISKHRSEGIAAEPSHATTPPTVPSPEVRGIRLNVNGESHDVDVEIGATLLDTLRDRLGLTGTKKGCETGACGACTVLVDRLRINACLTLAVMAEGSPIMTIEGVASGEDLHPLQQELIERDGLQCGYCTSGQIMSALGYLAEGHQHAASPASIREWMSGNLCRCGAYPNIVASIAAIAERSEVREREAR